MSFGINMKISKEWQHTKDFPHEKWYNKKTGAMIRIVYPTWGRNELFFVDSNMLLQGKRVDGYYKTKKQVSRIIRRFIKQHSS